MKKKSSKKKDNRILYAGVIIAILALSIMLLYTQTEVFGPKGAYYYTFNSYDTGDLPYDDEGDPCHYDWVACFSPIPKGRTYYAVTGEVKCNHLYDVTVTVGIRGEGGPYYELGTIDIEANSNYFHSFNFNVPYYPSEPYYWMWVTSGIESSAEVEVRNGKLYYTGYRPLCPPYRSEKTCCDNDCFWWEDENCHGAPPPVEGEAEESPPPIQWCSQFETKQECEDNGCFWYDGECHGTRKKSAQTLIGIISENPYIMAGLSLLIVFSIIGISYYILKKKGGKKDGKKKQK
jgi:hypothetical protein